ncbi:uncharacterized protein LOC134278004 [Saccostrea cucullata]|uniref:uncharacterized protein LOC134278004 n=1 Tax=Saccostrea cuccullata TaxID=36930 RepID=UPI002ECFF981
MNTLTPNVWFTVYGTTPTGQGPTGLAIWLDGVNQYIDMINQSSPCLHDLLKCRYGLTVIFNLYLHEFRTKMYIFTNGGDEKGFYGMSMWHERKRLFLSISTKSKIWNVNTKFITLRKYIKIQFSWSPQFGIRLYFDDLLVAQSSRFYKRYANNLADKFTVGCSLNQQYFFRGAIDGWNVIEAFIDTIKAYNISFDVPELTEDPILEFVLDETSQETRFLCKIKAGLSDIEYTVRWYQNDKIIKEETLIGRTVASLMEDDIEQLFYEDQIKCSVSPCVPGNCESLRGSWKHSNAFIAKVKVVSETQIIIHERSGYGMINVTSNIPPTLFCSKESRNISCEVAITTELAKYWWDLKCPGSLCPISQVVFGVFNSPTYQRPCSHLITTDTWHSGVIIPVKAAVDTLMDGDQTRFIRVFFTTVNETKLISTVQVTVVDEDKIAVCSSINDPHITTFDSRYYDNYLEGEFM